MRHALCALLLLVCVGLRLGYRNLNVQNGDGLDLNEHFGSSQSRNSNECTAGVIITKELPANFDKLITVARIGEKNGHGGNIVNFASSIGKVLPEATEGVARLTCEVQGAARRTRRPPLLPLNKPWCHL